MATGVFRTTVQPILVWCQLLGLIDICYTFESTGSSVQYTNSIYFKFLELARMFVLLICSYAVYKSEFYYSQKLDLLKFWVPITIARIWEMWIIKLINGIVEFDRKFALRLPALSTVQQPRVKCWNTVVTIVFAFLIAFKAYVVYLWPPKTVNVTVAVCYLFLPPSLMETTVAVTSWFFLRHLERRSQTLNDIIWERLPAGLVAVPGKWTHSRIAASLESVRLLHAELSDLLRTFNAGYGPLLLGFFVFSFVRILYYCLFCIKIALSLPGLSYTGNFLRNLPPYLINVQNMIFMTSTIILSSRIMDKVKLFMNQISFSESSEITAYGFFSINSNLIISILVLLITGFATLLQMKDHQILLRLVNNSTSSAKSSFHNINVT